jgi:hypothetical protein
MAGTPECKGMGLNELFEHLEDLLSRQLSIIQALYEGAQKQIGLLRDADVRGLMAVVMEQSGLADELARLERERLNARAVLEEVLELRPGLTLREILPLVPEIARERLGLLAEALREGLIALRNANDICLVMTRRGLQFNTELLRAMGLVDGGTYGVAGELTGTVIPQAVDNTV